MKQYQINGFLTDDQQVQLILKFQKLGLLVSFHEYAVSTIITIIKDK